jgi:hypothetical protein
MGFLLQNMQNFKVEKTIFYNKKLFYPSPCDFMKDFHGPWVASSPPENTTRS